MTRARVIASVQVRMGSERLPGKTMMPLGGQPLLGHLLDRLSHASRLDGVVVATPVGVENDPIAAYCARRGTTCFRGSEDDVLGRMRGALRMMEATVGVEAFGDSPLIDPAIVDSMIDRFVDAGGRYDFVGNDLTTTYPPGMEVEVFAMAALEDAAATVTDPTIREHGTLFIRQHPDLYRLLNVEAPERHRRPELELEVDTAEDAIVLARIVEHFAGRERFGLDDILAFADAHPEVTRANAQVPRRWKAMRSASA